jgi:class 3 adenylate cyclase/pimeloyl-ACP methyl ester carboxylesterase
LRASCARRRKRLGGGRSGGAAKASIFRASNGGRDRCCTCDPDHVDVDGFREKERQFGCLGLEAAHGVAVAVVASGARTGRQPELAADDPAFVVGVSRSGAFRGPGLTSISSPLRANADAPRRGQKNRPRWSRASASIATAARRRGFARATSLMSGPGRPMMERRLAAVLAADMVGYSRLVEADEDGVLSRQKALRTQVIDPRIAAYRGRIVKTTGDGLLAEFASAQDAVRCAIEIQTEMARQETDAAEDRRIRYRVGINLGDVVFEDDDIYGDGVNVAARLEGLAEPGGVCISDIVHQTVMDRLGEPFRDMGGQRVKNISRPIKVWQWSPGARPKRELPETALQQRVRYCSSADGAHLAYATLGEGPPVLKAPNWINHIEYEWQSPVWGTFLTEFAKHCSLTRFDQRGNGLSDWDVGEISEERMIDDMLTVADAAGLETFALFGISQGAAFSMRFAATHPERVRCLVLLGGYVRGRLRRGDPEGKRFYKIGHTMVRDGWGSPNTIYRHFFTSTYIPDATPQEAESFDELQRISTNTENALRILEMNAEVDARDHAAAIRAPTLILHCRDDRAVPVEESRLAARLIPGASFVELPGANHCMVGGHPGFREFFDEAMPFLREHAGG